MLVDISGIGGEHNSLGDIQPLHEIVERNQGRVIATLHAQYCGLSALTLSTSLALALRHVTTLTVSHNNLTTLQGIDAFLSVEFLDLSHNALRVLDAHSTLQLSRLKKLRRCDLSQNILSFIDFDILNSTTTQGNVTQDGDEKFTKPIFAELTVLNLAHNQLIELPDLRCMPLLEELNLEHNHIEYIADAENRLPLVALHSLLLAHNALASLHSLLPLTVLADTLRMLTVKGNPSVENHAVAKSSVVRSWLLWILPQLQSIDNIPLNVEERETASRLFRKNGELCYEAMEVMNGNKDERLNAYLHKFASFPYTRSVSVDVFSVGRRENNMASINDAGSLCPSLCDITTRIPVVRSSFASTANSTTQRPSPQLVLQMLQKKLKQLSKVVEVLWKESISRRVFATIVLQKHMRGFLTRRHLNYEMRRKFAQIRERLRCLNYKKIMATQLSHQLGSNHIKANWKDGSNGKNTNSNNNNTNNNNNESNTLTINENNAGVKQEYDALVSQVQSLELLLRQTCIDAEKFRRIIYRNENKAVITIQRYYRGYIDRKKKWRTLKKRYDDFVASLRPKAVILQRVCRGYLARVKLYHSLLQSCRMRRLEMEVAELRQAVVEMRSLMEQNMRRQRLEQYADPEKAMREIISRHIARDEDTILESETAEDVSESAATSSTGPHDC